MGCALHDVVRQSTWSHSHGVPCAGEAPTLAIPLASRSGDLALGLRCLAERVPEHASGQGPGVTPFFYQHLSVDDSIVNAFGEFSNAPPAGREIMHHIFGQRFHGVGIKNGDIGGHAWTEEATIVDT